MKRPVRVAITGAAGQIGYSLLFRIASGEMLGADQPVVLQLMEITPALGALKGVVMEINDCAYPLVAGIEATDDLEKGFGDAEFVMLVGARPRSKGMERGDLLTENGKIFKPQGKAINDFASKNAKVLVIGNPANTNALIAMNNARDLAPSQFSAMTRLDHNRAISQLAEKTGAKVTEIKKVAIWGNHSATQYPDLNHATIGGRPAMNQLHESWVREIFIPRVQKRGAEIIEARGLSSAASAAYAGLEHIRDWVSGTASGNWVSMAVPSDGSYDVPEGLIYSFPVTIRDGMWKIVRGLDIDDFSREKMTETRLELEQERDAVKELI